MISNPCALVTGANRGIGLAVAHALARRGHDLVLMCRDLQGGRDAAASLAREAVDVRVVQLDLEDPTNVDRALSELDAVRVGILVNNAGIHPPGGVLDATCDDFRRSMETHFFGPLRLIRGLVPSMVEAGWGRVVNVSSGSGSFSQGLPGPAPYSVSKATLNALTVKLAAEVPDTIKVNAVCPGWVRTRMGGREAIRSVREGADSVVWLATLPGDGPTGGFFRLREPVGW